MASRRVFKYDFTLAAGSATTNVELPIASLGRATALILELTLTTALTDSVDTLDVRFQEIDSTGVTWDTRAAFAQLLGNMTVSASAPEIRKLVLITTGGSLDSTEHAYEPTGSAGAAAMTAGTVRNGPLVGVRRNVTTGGNQNPAISRGATHRVSFVVVDADADASFIGNLTIWAVTPDYS